MAYGTEKVTTLWRGQKLDEVKAYWAQELAHLTRDELARGFESMRGKHPSWPPTLYDFIDLCRPAQSAIDPETAFHEAVRGCEQRKLGEPGKWSNRAIYWASIDVSAFDVLNSTWPQIRARWSKALETRLVDQNLPEIPEPPKQLAAPPPISRDEKIPALEVMREQVGGEAKRNARAWVKAIIDRHAAGDKTLPDIAYRMALNSENIR